MDKELEKFSLQTTQLVKYQHNTFANLYEVVYSDFFLPNQIDQYRLNGQKYKCRLCGTSGKKNFGKPHLLPDFLSGNILTYGECQKCNNKFSQLEGDFAKFLEFDRTWKSDLSRKKNTLQHFGDEQYSKYANISSLSAEALSFIPKEISRIMLIRLVEDDFKALKDNIIEIHTKIKPSSISKVLVKIAMLLLEETEVTSYPNLVKWLANTSLTNSNDRMPLTILIHPFAYNIFGYTELLLFRLKENNPELPDYMLVINYFNKSIQIPITELESKKIQVHIVPLTFSSILLRRYSSNENYSNILFDSRNWRHFVFNSFDTRKHSIQIAYKLPPFHGLD